MLVTGWTRLAKRLTIWVKRSKARVKMQMMPGVGLKLSAIFVKLQPPQWQPPSQPFLPPLLLPGKP